MLPLKYFLSVRSASHAGMNKESLAHFLVFAFPTLCFFVVFNYLLGFQAIALTETFVLFLLPMAYVLLRTNKHLVLVGHIIAGLSCILFSALVLLETQANTGIYWIFGYPFIVYFYVGLKHGTPWIFAYFLVICTALLMAVWQLGSVPYTVDQLSLAFIALMFFSLLAYLYIRDREASEKSIRNSEYKFHTLYTHSHDAILLYDGEVCLDCNQAACQMFAVPDGQSMCALSDLSLEHHVIRDLLSESQGRSINTEIVCKRLNKAAFSAEISLVFVEIQDVQVMQVVVRDISDRKEAEKQQQKYLYHLQCMDQLELILNQNMEIEAVLDQTLHWMLRTFSCSRAWLLYPCDPSSKSWSVVYEKTLAAYPGLLSIGDVMPMDEVARAVMQEALNCREPICYDPSHPLAEQGNGLKAFGIRAQIVMSLQPKSGQAWMLGIHECDYGRLWTEEEQRLFKDCATRVEAMLGRLLLYKDLKDSERALRQQTAQAEAANRAKSDFLSVMSHELRTPIHGVIGLLDLITEDKQQLSAEQQQHLRMARKTAQALRSLVSDILDLSKVESGAIQLHQKEIDLSECLIATLLSFVPQIRQKNLKFSLELQQVPQSIMVDQLRFRQIILNLVGNAVKFTDQGHVLIQVAYDKHISRLTVNIMDSGIGIRAEHLDKIFEPFVQESDFLSESPRQGTGLGTSIVKRFVELMGGEISVHSRVGEGSCFSFYIQADAVGERYISDIIDLDAEKLLDANESNRVFHPIFKNASYKVIVAEDDPVAQLVMRKSLTKAKMQVDMVSSGEQCWALLQKNHYDLLLTDLRMPGLDGLALTKKLRQLEKDNMRSPMLVIGLSAHALEDVIDACLEAGMDEFMTKPVQVQDVLKVIYQHTRK